MITDNIKGLRLVVHNGQIFELTSTSHLPSSGNGRGKRKKSGKKNNKRGKEGGA